VWQKAAVKKLRHDLGPRSGYRIFDSQPDEMLEGAWQLNAALLGAFRDAVEADGARLVLVLCPAGGQIYDDMWELVLERAGAQGASYDRDYPRARLRGIADSGAISVLDLTPRLRAGRGAERAAAVSDDERLYLAGGEGHLSRKGNHDVALEIERFLTEGGFR
jgi:hypothetical protein